PLCVLSDILIRQPRPPPALFVKRSCGSTPERSFRAANWRGVRPICRRHVHAHASSLLSRRVAHRAASLSVLVEQLVWPPPLRPADHGISDRRQAPPPHPAGSGASRRAHHTPRFGRAL